MYLRFGAPIDTTRPGRTPMERWVSTIKQRAQDELTTTLTDLQRVRDGDPYRELNPLAWRAAVMPEDATVTN